MDTSSNKSVHLLCIVPISSGWVVPMIMMAWQDPKMKKMRQIFEFFILLTNQHLLVPARFVNHGHLLSLRSTHESFINYATSNMVWAIFSLWDFGSHCSGLRLDMSLVLDFALDLDPFPL